MAKKKKTIKKKSKAGEKSPAQKAADTMRKRRLEEAAKKAGRFGGVTDKPAVEKSDVKITPYPRTGDNKEFEAVLDEVGLEPKPSPASKSATPEKPAGPAAGDEILTVEDVAEWVAWPFMLWAQSNSLGGLALSAKEAKSVAEPLTSILNRHGASRVFPPDMIDGLKAGARLTPIMGDRFEAIKRERARRAAGGRPDMSKATVSPGGNVPQGGQATKPKEV